MNTQPLVVSYGMGVDSTAMLVGMQIRGIRPDAILFADTGAEKNETYAYLETFNAWLASVGFPQVTVLQYRAQNFKNWPAYHTLEENCLTNGTLPSEAFGFGSCSMKWKQQPQNKWMKAWAPAQAAWKAGLKIKKAIGYDSSPADQKRRCSADKITFKVDSKDAKKYDFWYPLQEWGWTRVDCVREIAKAGLPVPFKSSCFYCPNMKADEVNALPKGMLQRIVVMEARAAVRLEGHMDQPSLDASYEKKLAKWQEKANVAREQGLPLPAPPKRKVAGQKGLMRGLWRSKMMIDHIRAKGLLPTEEVSRLATIVPKEIVLRNEAKAAGNAVESWDQFFSRVGVEN
jgi:hypothetical protein